MIGDKHDQFTLVLSVCLVARTTFGNMNVVMLHPNGNVSDGQLEEISKNCVWYTRVGIQKFERYFRVTDE